jgi:hypothetical protein
MYELTERIEVLAKERAVLATLQQTRDEVVAEIDASELGQRLRATEDSITESNRRLRQIEEQVRILALAKYSETGDKKPAPGIGIRVMKKMVYDEGAAIEWCKDHGGMFVVEALDKKPFERVAVDIGAPVTVEERPIATIAKELSGAA